MGVDHGGADVFVSEQFLDGADVVAVLEEVGGKGVAKGMTGDTFSDAGFAGGFFYGALEAGGFEVVAAGKTPFPACSPCAEGMLTPMPGPLPLEERGK